MRVIHEPKTHDDPYEVKEKCEYCKGTYGILDSDFTKIEILTDPVVFIVNCPTCNTEIVIAEHRFPWDVLNRMKARLGPQ